VNIRDIPPQQAHLLLPLLHQVHDLHLAHQPTRYAPLPNDPEMERYLSNWLSAPGIGALGYEMAEALVGYVVFEREERPQTPFRRAETRVMMHQICVDRNQRRQGVGLALIEAVRSHPLATQAHVIAAGYASFNCASAGLMQRAGLTPVLSMAESRTG